MILSAAALLGSGRAWDLFRASVIADVHGVPELTHDPRRTHTIKGYPWVFDQRMPGVLRCTQASTERLEVHGDPRDV
jgi:hypothetical protein